MVNGVNWWTAWQTLEKLANRGAPPKIVTKLANGVAPLVNGENGQRSGTVPLIQLCKKLATRRSPRLRKLQHQTSFSSQTIIYPELSEAVMSQTLKTVVVTAVVTAALTFLLTYSFVRNKGA